MVEGLLRQPRDLDLHPLHLDQKVAVELVQVLLLLVPQFAGPVDLVREVPEILGRHDPKSQRSEAECYSAPPLSLKLSLSTVS